MNRKLTREEAIRLHRKMWTDMQTELGDEPGPYERMDFKKEWVQERFPNEHINSNCFLCEYAKQLKITKGLGAHYKCDYCPIAWNSNDDPECAPGYDFFGIMAWLITGIRLYLKFWSFRKERWRNE